MQLPVRLDQWGAESAPAYRALIGLSFLWHEPGRTHAPKGGRWIRKTGLDPYDPITDEDAIALAFPSSKHSNQRLLAPTDILKGARSEIKRNHPHTDTDMDILITVQTCNVCQRLL